MNFKRFIATRAGAVAAAVAILSIVVVTVAGTATFAGADAEPQLRFGEHRPSGNPVALTPEQCQQAAANLAEFQREDRPRLVERLDAGGMEQLDVELNAGQQWVGRGCPPDPVRGFYPAADGKGGELRILNVQAFSTGGTLSLSPQQP